MKHTIYTHGKNELNADSLIHMLNTYKIACVVGITRHIQKKLQNTLRDNGFHYLPFQQHFEDLPPKCIGKRDNPLYNKAIKTEQFLNGIARIRQGIDRGYTILLLDANEDTKTSPRYTLLGKYLSSDYNILHIDTKEHYVTQEKLDAQILADKERKKQANTQRAEIGANGEELAALYLIKQGYRIIDRNWNLHLGCELDIVAHKNNKYHFIEVKTRTSDRYSAPQVAIDRTKMRHLVRAINRYRNYNKIQLTDYQLDSIAIIYHNDNDYTIRHFEDIRPY